MIPDEEEVAYAKELVDKVIDGKMLTDEDLVMPESTEIEGNNY
jgi:hypothetical protein